KLYGHLIAAKENLCLYGHPDKRWQVTEPLEGIPAIIPEPALGINFARDGMDMEKWIAFVASRSDVWLHSVAFYYIGVRRFGRTERERLFNMINELPTILEVISGTAKKQSEWSSSSSSKKPESSSKVLRPRFRFSVILLDLSLSNEEKEDVLVKEEEEQGETPCGTCEENYLPDEFWICCDFCETWYHGKCVKITPEMAEHIEQYECPICNNKRARA
ncbi:hypothetical protein Leryth_004982, partial [Lithospermum erythrorhizon]